MKYTLFIIIFPLIIFAKENNAIQIGFDDDYPPYSFVLNNELKGIYVDIIKLALQKIHP